MVGVAGEDGEGAVEAFEDDQAGQLVGQGPGTQGKAEGSGEGLETMGAAQGDVQPGQGGAPIAQPVGEVLGGEGPAVDIELEELVGGGQALPDQRGGPTAGGGDGSPAALAHRRCARLDELEGAVRPQASGVELEAVADEGTPGGVR